METHASHDEDDDTTEYEDAEDERSITNEKISEEDIDPWTTCTLIDDALSKVRKEYDDTYYKRFSLRVTKKVKRNSLCANSTCIAKGCLHG